MQAVCAKDVVEDCYRSNSIDIVVSVDGYGLTVLDGGVDSFRGSLGARDQEGIGKMPEFRKEEFINFSFAGDVALVKEVAEDVGSFVKGFFCRRDVVTWDPLEFWLVHSDDGHYT